MPRFSRVIGSDVRVWFGNREITGQVRSITSNMEPNGFGTFTIEAYQSDDLYRAINDVAESDGKQDTNMSKNISTKEQVEVRTQMADVIKEAIEAKYGKVRTWVETETVGPLGGISAKVLGAVEHEGKIVPFAIQVYSDERIVEALEEQLIADGENDKLRDKLGW